MTAKFNSSAEASAHIDAIANLLADPRLAQWLQATDVNWFVNTTRLLQQTKETFEELQEVLDNCC